MGCKGSDKNNWRLRQQLPTRSPGGRARVTVVACPGAPAGLAPANPPGGQAWHTLVTVSKKRPLLHTHVLPLPTPLEQTRQVGTPLVSSQLLGVAVQAQAVTTVEPAGAGAECATNGAGMATASCGG
jgi:hypothetical protein